MTPARRGAVRALAFTAAAAAAAAFPPVRYACIPLGVCAVCAWGLAWWEWAEDRLARDAARIKAADEAYRASLARAELPRRVRWTPEDLRQLAAMGVKLPDEAEEKQS